MMFPNLAFKLIALSRPQKKVLMLIVDFMLIPLSLWGAWALRLGEFWPSNMQNSLKLFPLITLGSIIVFAKLGLYRAVIHFMGMKAIRAIAFGGFVSSCLLLSLVFLFRLDGFPRSISIIYALLLFICIGGSRWGVRSLYQHLRFQQHAKAPVIIYGAGEAGLQLAKSLISGEDFFPSAFLDDDKALHGCTVHDITVYDPAKLSDVINLSKAKRVLLAVPSATQEERKNILDKMNGLPLRVQTIPSLEAIVSGAAMLNQLQDVDVEDLLGRDPVPPKEYLFSACIRDRNVLVTGAGGSIGSELCRQILRTSPKTLVLYELTELALYSIDQELRELLKSIGENSIEVVPILGSVCDRKRVNEVLLKYDIHTVYHAAAYKHVPLVEGNMFQGIKNNIFGTRTLAQSAEIAGVKNFVLISTDKAVRPTNVMGATKRTAELILQAMAANGSDTVFSMVRFGNVLGSSGSVIPLFKKQIVKGGPITVTHKDITRFFMTIPEAAQLVIQAGALGEGGDVFVLDMGDSVRIFDMAQRMIHLYGKTIRDQDNPNGDIEISIVGLRSGEKLYEELLVGENVQPTEHPKIMKAYEIFMPIGELDEKLAQLEGLESLGNYVEARELLQKIVTGFTPSSPIVDYLNRSAKEVA